MTYETKYFVAHDVARTPNAAVSGAGARASKCKQKHSTGVHSTAFVSPFLHDSILFNATNALAD